MTMLLPYFTQAEISEQSDVTTVEARREVLDKIKQYNRFYSGQPRSLAEHIWDLPVLTRRMLRYLSTQDGITFMMNARVVPYLLITVVYALSPFDILPGIDVIIIHT